MALPVIDSSVSLQTASTNVLNYVKDNDGVKNIFIIEALRHHINTIGITPIRKHDLLYIIDMYI